MQKSYINDKNDYIPFNKIKFDIINKQQLNACLYLLSSNHIKQLYIYQEELVLILLQHYIDINYNKYDNVFSQFSSNKIDTLLLQLYKNIILANNINLKVLVEYLQLCKQYNYKDEALTNHIYNYLKNNDIITLNDKILILKQIYDRPKYKQLLMELKANTLLNSL